MRKTGASELRHEITATQCRGKVIGPMTIWPQELLRACFKNGARLCRRPAAAEGACIISPDFMGFCGWSRTTQPRSIFSKSAFSQFISDDSFHTSTPVSMHLCERQAVSG